MPYPPVIVVDENDNEVGSAMLAEVWKKGLYHRIVSIFVEDDRGRMLLQQRGPSMKLFPGRWDQAAGGHVDEGHDYDQAATLELAEEIGLHDVALTAVATFPYHERFDGRIINQFVRVYSVKVPHDVVLQPEAKEVSKLQWFTLAELKAQVAKHPEDFTPGLLHDLRKFFPTVLG